MNCVSKTTTSIAPTIHLMEDGRIVCGTKIFCPENHSLSKLILRTIAKNPRNTLYRQQYQDELICGSYDPTLGWRPEEITHELDFIRRQNNIDKALSRLRIDLTKYFSDMAPEGIHWICFSRKIDGWLLYKLPSLGSDGFFH